MKTVLFSLPCLLLALATPAAFEHGATRLMMREPSRPAPPEPETVCTYSSFDQSDARRDRDKVPAGSLRFLEADLQQVLDIYQELSGRTVLRPASLPAAKTTLRTQTPLARREALQAMDTVLAQNGIAMVLMGTKFVRAVPVAQASTEGGPVVELPVDQLPESKSYMIREVHLKNADPTEVLPVLQPFAGLPNSIVAVRASKLIILRDFSINIRRMLELLPSLDVKPRPDAPRFYRSLPRPAPQKR